MFTRLGQRGNRRLFFEGLHEGPVSREVPMRENLGGGFRLSAVYVAIGEAAVRLVVGTALYYARKKRGRDKTLFA